MGFRFGKFTYITDANRIEDHEKQKIMGSEVLVLNELRKKKHISHFNLDEAIALVKELKSLLLILPTCHIKWENMQKLKQDCLTGSILPMMG